jgi:hypothetical protein
MPKGWILKKSKYPEKTHGFHDSNIVKTLNYDVAGSLRCNKNRRSKPWFYLLSNDLFEPHSPTPRNSTSAKREERLRERE